MNICNLSATTFLRTLLEQCVGTVMIEAEQWDFPTSTFDRGYFNYRLKQNNAINHLTHERLNFVFAHLFQPQSPNSRFQEPQAVEAANHLIALFQQLFQVDCSLWTNMYTADNSIARSHLLTCLDNVQSWNKKEIQYETGRHRYYYIIASAVRVQYQEQLYQACQNSIYDITIEMQQHISKTDVFSINLIQFSWALRDIFVYEKEYVKHFMKKIVCSSVLCNVSRRMYWRGR